MTLDRVMVSITPSDREDLDAIVEATIDVVESTDSTVYLVYLFPEGDYESLLEEMDIEPTSGALSPDELASRHDSVRTPASMLEANDIDYEIRGVAGGRAAGYGSNFEEYLAAANDALLTIVQIESEEAVENAEGIAAVEGIDALFVGPSDLSTSLDGTADWGSEALLEAMERVIDVNLKGYLRVARASISALSDTNGTLINVSSQLGSVGVPDASVYCATKGGIDNLTRQLAVECAEDGVRVNGLAPGVVDTAMTPDDDEEWEAQKRAMIPLDRIASPDEIAAPAVFLASDDASYLTGHVLVVDGGYLAQ
jgi:NAD(P)-dependent dehydrogenase (short-subunit alcohol dehydrogenase family)